MAETPSSTEIWKPVTIVPGYEASSLGRVRRIAAGWRTKPGHILKQSKNVYGYYCVALWNGTGPIQVKVNRLIAHTFYGPPPTPEHHAAHGDGDKTNNRMENLRWATPKENGADARRHGTRKGELHSRAKLTAEQVGRIRALGAEGATLGELAGEYAISKAHVCNILKGKYW